MYPFNCIKLCLGYPEVDTIFTFNHRKYTLKPLQITCHTVLTVSLHWHQTSWSHDYLHQRNNWHLFATCYLVSPVIRHNGLGCPETQHLFYLELQKPAVYQPLHWHIKSWPLRPNICFILSHRNHAAIYQPHTVLVMSLHWYQTQPWPLRYPLFTSPWTTEANSSPTHHVLIISCH
jgi:hypothetical protein